VVVILLLVLSLVQEFVLRLVGLLGLRRRGVE